MLELIGEVGGLEHADEENVVVPVRSRSGWP
jgi:hypothetical protein